MSLFTKGINKYLLQTQWNVGLINEPASSFLHESPARRIEWLPIFDHRKFAADPFGIEKDGAVYIFCEYFDFQRWKGDIACIKFADNQFHEPEIVLTSPYHMSFPYMLQHQDRFYCVPSVARSGQVVLYSARDFPYDWQKETVLLDDFAGADNSLFIHDGYWWLFNVNLNSNPHADLYVWYSRELTGEWRPHEKFPVKKDIRSSRPAGPVFSCQGELYRPSMDNTDRYGGAVNINRIVTLNPREFSEETVASVLPDKNGQYRSGLHTLSEVSERYTLIDGKRMKFIAAASIAKAKRKLGMPSICCSWMESMSWGPMERSSGFAG